MNFVNWLQAQPKGHILPSQVGATLHILDRLRTPDLVIVLNHGSDDLAIKSFVLLRERYEDEMRWLDEMNATRESDEEVDWG